MSSLVSSVLPSKSSPILFKSSLSKISSKSFDAFPARSGSPISSTIFSSSGFISVSLFASITGSKCSTACSKCFFSISTDCSPADVPLSSGISSCSFILRSKSDSTSSRDSSLSSGAGVCISIALPAAFASSSPSSFSNSDRYSSYVSFSSSFSNCSRKAL